MNLPSEGDTFTPKAATLGVLLPDIQRHKIALPEFQRDWVWDPDMVRDLLISVAYRYPAGSLLTMSISGEGFALRPFAGAGDKLKDTPNLLILDGQQRLTSLYQALFRRDGVQHKRHTYHFYASVPTLMEDPDGSIEMGDPYFDQALFYIREEKSGRRMRYDGLQPMYELTTLQDELEAGALPLGCIFDGDALTRWKEAYLSRQAADLPSYKKLNNEWDRLVHAWLVRIRTYRFPVVELHSGMPLGAICHIFEKVNSTGVPLNVFDLCNAILWAQGFHLNCKWADTEKKLKETLPMQTLSGTYFLQGLSLLDSLDRKRANPNQGIAVGCRKQDLMAMRHTTVEKWWDVLVKGYEEAAKFMAEQGILSPRILPYSTLITPLSAIFADLKRRKGDAHVGAAWLKVERWYWCSVFSQRYSSQIETASARDFEQVLHWIDGGEPPDIVRTFGFRSDALQEITSIRNAIYKGVLCLLARNGAKDFGGGGKLSTHLFYNTNQDHHHIFPTNALKNLDVKDPRANTIVNKTLISGAVNHSIGGRRPAEYVKAWRGKLGDTLFDEILETHLVSAAYLSRDDWEAFVLDRRERLRQMIAAACGGNVQPFSDTPDHLEVEEDEEEA
jgi:hypothetical protein